MSVNLRTYPFLDYCLSSELELPELGAPRDLPPANPVIEITVGTPGPLQNVNAEWIEHGRDEAPSLLTFGRLQRSCLLRAGGIGDFVIDVEAGRVRCHAKSETPPGALRHILLDQVLPRLAGQRGNLVLHASAACLENSAVIFSGSSGFGKSTLAASFHAPLAPPSDDCLLLRERGDSEILTIPGYAGTRLWPDSIETLYDRPPKPQPTGADTGKKRLPGCATESQPAAMPLSAIFILNDPIAERSEEINITPLRGKEALMALMGRGFLLDPGEVKVSRQLWMHAGSVVRAGVPLARLSYPRDYAALQAVRDAVVDFVDCASSERMRADHGEP